MFRPCSNRTRLDWFGQFWLSSFALFVAVASAAVVVEEDPDRCAKLYLSGDYAGCAAAAREAIGRGDRDESWWLWGVRAELVQGQSGSARELLEAGLAKNPYSVRLRLLAYELDRKAGDRQRAEATLREIDRLAGRSSWRYSSPADRVALGRAALLLGADPRQVLELFFDRVRKEQKPPRDVFLASGELALEKHDDAVAAQSYEDGLKLFPNDPDLHFGLARSFAHSDPKRTKSALDAALQSNPHHVPALLFLADHAIDSEQYDEARSMLDRVNAVDPSQAEAWSYRAVLAHLEGDFQSETAHRTKALETASGNPAVDHLIGRKLSQKYRFQEGVQYQRRSLELDGDYLPAQMQLAQDLLRLGEEEGWQLAQSVHARDRYDITAYNLVTLHDTIEPYRLLQEGNMVVRMEPREAELYGDRVLDLLRRAAEVLGTRYGLEITERVTVELFPRQSDFAVRTFGLPGGAGYLGVCFGKLVTANSPASQGDSPTSWESVLWHEFCHVVTLQLTRNKMPRWLSEGISVYEERQRDPAWGQVMTPEYREMIRSGELTPVGRLSGAFLSPPTARHLQFAYYQSSLVVQFLVECCGHELLRGVLEDLGKDVPINSSLERHTKRSMAELEADFEEYARGVAESLAGDTDFDRDGLPKPDAGSVQSAEWLKQHPRNFWGNLMLAANLIRERKHADAIEPLERAVELYPGYTGPGNAYEMLAEAYRQLDRPADERRELDRLVALDADKVAALIRLVELDAAAADWQALDRHAQRLLGVNPLLGAPHRALAQAAEQLGDRPAAIAAYRKLLLLDPEDPAEVHYRLAKLMHDEGDPAAKRHVLMALEEAPRFPEALRLLLKLDRARSGGADPTEEPAAPKPNRPPNDDERPRKTR